MRNLRRGLLAATSLLILMGVVMIYSTSAIYAEARYGDSMFFLKRHLIYLFFGLLASGWVLSLDPKTIRRWVKPFLGITLLGLVAVMVPGIGHRVSGASRWFRIGWFNFQPSELSQIAVILYLADVLTRKRGEMTSFLHGVLPALVVSGITMGLILIEPDLGTAVALGAVAIMLLFIAGIQKRVLAGLLALALPVMVALIAFKPYRLRRFLAYVNPWADPEGAGFQLIQSLVALGSGGLFGVGLGGSRQKLFYLPAAHTDFIFAVIGEELGLLGATAVILLFGFLAWYGIRLALASSDGFGTFVGLGIVFLFLFEAAVHMAVTMGAIPTKGLPLPFVSYGGTAMVLNMASVALLLNVTRPRQVEA